MRNLIFGLVLTMIAACSSRPTDDELNAMGPHAGHEAIDRMNNEHAGDTTTASPPQGDIATIKQAATYSFFTPFTAPASVLVVVGEYPYTHDQWVVFWRSTDFYCEWHQVGDANGLWGPVTVMASHETWADMEAPGWGQVKNVYCANLGTSYNLTMPKQVSNSNRIEFQGTGTGDYFNCSGDAGVSCYGFSGNDIFDAWSSNTTMYGGPGDDKMRFHTVWGSKTWMLGQDGSDCLQSDTTPPAWVNTLEQYDCDWAGMGGDASNTDRSTGILGTHCNTRVAVGSCN
jgi:hypothetical protein